MIIVSIVILACGLAIGAACVYWYMQGRVEFWQDKYMIERNARERILRDNMEWLSKHLDALNQITGKRQGVGEVEQGEMEES
jgi:hypothetical protein